MTAGETRPGGKSTAAHRAHTERKALGTQALVHGAYYSGLVDDTTMVGRWNEHKRCFVYWESQMGGAKLKTAGHVAEGGPGAQFAPLAEQKEEGDFHISDFAFETA